MDVIQQAPREKLTIELILRKSFRDSCVEYSENCSLSGTKMMRAKSKVQRILWALAFISALGTIFYFLVYIWNATLSKPLIVTLESQEYPINEIDFPAVAVCNINRISKKALVDLAKEEYKALGHRKEVEKTFLNFGRLIDYTYNESLKRNPVFLKMVEKYRLEYERIVPIMKSLAPRCNEMLLRCAWAGEIVDCSTIFNLRRTANRGHCCTFNYILNFNSQKSFFKIERKQILKQTTPGMLHGLSVVLEPQVDDYAYSLRDFKGFDILLFDPMHYPDPTTGGVTHRVAEPDQALFIEIKSTKQVATKEIKKYNIQTRNCFFSNEFDEEYSGYYSYSACLVSCKVVTIQSLCKCVPFFMALNTRFLKYPVCTFEDLRCLEKYKTKLMYMYPFQAEVFDGLETELEDSLSCPECLPDCEITKHSIRAFSAPFLADNREKTIVDSYYKGINVTGKSTLHIYNPTNDARLVRLDVVYYWYEILSNFGGFCGIILGLSIANVMEVIYFFTVRYCRHFYSNYQKYH